MQEPAQIQRVLVDVLEKKMGHKVGLNEVIKTSSGLWKVTKYNVDDDTYSVERYVDVEPS